MGVILNNVVGFSLFGLAVRFWQLGIQHRPMNYKLWVHASYMAAFGFVGYEVVKIEAWQAKTLQELKEIREKNRGNMAAREDARLKRIGVPAQEEARAAQHA